MESNDYLDGSQDYDGLYPHTIMETDSKEPLQAIKRNTLPMRNFGKHFDCFCGKIFTSKADYNRHMLVHTGERPHECDFCDKSFSLKGNLTKHMQLHTDEKSFHCPVCGKSFLKKGYIDQHMRIHTGEKPFVCLECNRAFSLKGNLSQHMKLHTDEKSFHCLECNKLFLKKSYLVQHMRVHSGIKPHKCNMCSRAFTLKGNLDQHIKRHSGRKPFECDECGKAFALKGALKEHEKVHGGEKPFICGVCSKAFNKKAYLIQHERTHTGERPFPCLECGKAFSQRSILNQHMRQHGERSYKCAQCHQLFVKKLTELPKNTRTVRFGVLKCKACEEASEDPSVEDVMQGFLKSEHSSNNYDDSEYDQNDHDSLYNIDNNPEPEEMQRSSLLSLLPLKNEPCSSSNIETGETSSRVYDFNAQPMQTSSIPRNSADVRNCMNYSQKKVAYAHAVAKENSKKHADTQLKSSCGPSLSNQKGAVELSAEESKKARLTYTELKVSSQLQNHSDGHQGTADVRDNESYSGEEVDTHKSSNNSERKPSISAIPIGGKSDQHTGESSKESNNHIQAELSQRTACHTQNSVEIQSKESTERNQHGAPKPTIEESNFNKSSEDAMRRNVHPGDKSDRSLEYMYKKHPAFMSMESQGNMEFGQRSAFHTSHEGDGNDAKRSFMYSPPSLTEYNARYLESLRDPFQRGFPGIRQGSVPEMESALSRFGFKGYYNTPWSFAGNYPD